MTQLEWEKLKKMGFFYMTQNPWLPEPKSPGVACQVSGILGPPK
jgi:hypothetical protein